MKVLNRRRSRLMIQLNIETKYKEEKYNLDLAANAWLSVSEKESEAFLFSPVYASGSVLISHVYNRALSSEYSNGNLWNILKLLISGQVLNALSAEKSLGSGINDKTFSLTHKIPEFFLISCPEKLVNKTYGEMVKQ